ncbi:MAG: glycerate kinase type-2 family protein [Verrucomicrobiota bacterium]
MTHAPKEPLLRCFRAALDAVDPSHLVSSALRADGGTIRLAAPGAEASLPREALGKIYLVGGGKAGRAMGESALRALEGSVSDGVLAVPRGQGGSSGPLRFIEAGHPVPDIGSFAAARNVLAVLEKASANDLVIALISGGGSAMISAPVDGVTAEQKAEVSRLLLRSGADIASFNAVRKHLSEVKGGWLARAAHPATVWALLLSDVPGDDPSVIASGPFTPDPTTFADAIGVLERYGLLYAVPAAVRWHLSEGASGNVPDTPKPGDPVFRNVTCALIGSNGIAMEAAARTAQEEGAEVTLLPGFLRGEARDCARAFCSRLRAAAVALPPGRSAAVIAGGETTVRVSGKGKGGRNQEFALAAAIELAEEERIAVLAGGTDGVDGPTDAAGAYADGSTLARAETLGMSARDHLDGNDAYPFFQALGDLVVTGPTGTNVADLVIGFARSPW